MSFVADIVETEEIEFEETTTDSSSLAEYEEVDRETRVVHSSSRRIDVFSVFTRAAINLFLPFINGMMLGFGEIFAHELGFRWGFTGARVLPRNNRRIVEVKK